VFVVASARDDFDPAAVLFEFDGVRRDIAPSRQAREGLAGGIEIGPSGGRLTDLNPTLDTRAKDGPIRNQLAGAVMQPYTLAIRGRGDTHQLEYRQDGTANALLTPNGGRGGIGVGAVAIHENQRAEVTLNDTAGAVKCAGGKPGQGYPAAMVGMAVRRLTPVECEKLQGFPTVSEKITIEACLDHQNQSVRAVLKCLRWQNSAWPADESELRQHARTAALVSNTPQASQEPLAALHVRMHSVDELLAIHSAGKLIWSANGAAPSSTFPPHTPTASTVQELARLQREVVKTILSGKAESPLSISLSFPASSGATSAEKSGQETKANASDATSDQSLGTFTTSDLGRFTTSSDSTAEILFCSVLRAIAGCIPSETLPETFSIELTVETPYTAIPWRKKPASECPDGPRYKALGNSWAVPVVSWIGRRIAAAIAKSDAEAEYKKP
jgi:hypothetical protein